ncbi:MAG: FIST C-terminal domain-containing protein [Betaproteobacteria bacterium]|nr:FIST C-terminal domain-containing protein [Betaproteobacteria bacterium]
MRIRQAVVHDLADASLDDLAEIQPQLVLGFAATRFFADAGFAPWLARAFPDARRLAVSTAGEISGRGVSRDSAVITALRFERATFKVAYTGLMNMDDSRNAGARLAARLPAEGLRAVFLLSQGVAVNGSELIAGVVSVLGKGIPLTGGLAGDNGAFARTWALLDDAVSDRLMLAVGFYGEALDFAHGCFGGWQRFGPARRATRAAGNVLHELDGEPALDVYRRYLGDYADGLPASGLLFPLALLSDEHEETGLIRTLLGVGEVDGSLTLAGDVPEGGYLKLMHASTEALVDGAEAAARAVLGMARKGGRGLAILVSCVGRGLAMGDRVDEEVEAVGDVLGAACPLAGFYSNGEISPFRETTECKLHNQTMTITYLGE